MISTPTGIGRDGVDSGGVYEPPCLLSLRFRVPLTLVFLALLSASRQGRDGLLCYALSIARTFGLRCLRRARSHPAFERKDVELQFRLNLRESIVER